MHEHIVLPDGRLEMDESAMETCFTGGIGGAKAFQHRASEPMAVRSPWERQCGNGFGRAGNPDSVYRGFISSHRVPMSPYR